MRVKLRNLVLLVLVSCFSVSAQALLIDHGHFTTDTDTGLDWLDVTESVDLTYHEVRYEMREGGLFEGWEYASEAQLIELIASAGDTVAADSVTYLNELNEHSVADSLIALLGSTIDASDVLNGRETWDARVGFEEGEGLDMIYGLLGDVINEWPHANQKVRVGVISDADWEDHRIDSVSLETTQRMNLRRLGMGSFLIRDTATGGGNGVVSVSEPASLSLLGLGLLGLSWVRRRA